MSETIHPPLKHIIEDGEKGDYDAFSKFIASLYLL